MTVRRGLLVLAFALVVLALTVARPATTWGPLLRDFEAYWSAGQTYDAGLDPYGRSIWNAERSVPGVDPHRDEILPFVSPPSTLPLWGAFGRLSYSWASTIWWVVMVLALCGIIVASLRGAGTRLTALTFCAALVLAVGFGPATSNLALGQMAMVAFFGALLASCGSQLRFVQPLSVFVAFFQPNVAIGLLAQLGRNRTTIAVAAGAALSYLVGALAAGWSWPVRYATLVRFHEHGERFSAIQITPGAVAYGLYASAGEILIVTVLTAALAIIAGIVLWRRIADRFARFAAISCLAPFVATFFHEHDLIVAFPAAVLCATRARGAARAIGLAGTMLVAIDWFGLAQRSNAVAQSALLATAAIVAFAALGEEPELRAVLRSAVPVLALFIAGVWVGTANPMPIWPDHLGSFHAPAAATISSVWFTEQKINGLEDPIPAWALLRSLSLFGCVLLAYAIYLKYRRPSYYRTALPARD